MLGYHFGTSKSAKNNEETSCYGPDFKTPAQSDRHIHSTLRVPCLVTPTEIAAETYTTNTGGG